MIVNFIHWRILLLLIVREYISKSFTRFNGKVFLFSRDNIERDYKVQRL